MTLIHAFDETVSRHGDAEFLRYHDGTEYVSLSYSAVAARIERVATGLIALGLDEGDRIAILSENRPEWAITDYAAMCAGLVTVPLYPTLPPQQIAFILRDSEARAIVVSTESQLAKIREIRQNLPQLNILIAMDLENSAETNDAIPFAEVENRFGTKEEAHRELLVRRKALQPEQVVTFIYTSGTTGNPKGVILSHDNFLSNVQAGLQVLRVTSNDVFLSFLPLCHVFERMAGHYLAMVAGAAIGYSRGLRYLVDELKLVRPTVMACVPRFYESLQERILKKVEGDPPARQKVFHWAMRQGTAVSRTVRENRRVGALLSLKNAIAQKLVFHKLQETVGGRLRFFVSGGAPLALSTAEFFHAAGILILEGYGLTETSPVIAVNGEDDYRFGTVGKPIPGIEVAIADDGEILTRGRHVMKGYFRLPEETEATIAPDGWLHTGDLGELDADGFLKITGRKKNLLKLSNGKYVAPEPIENLLKASPYIAEAVVIGDARKVAGALIVPSFPVLQDFAQREGIPTDPRSHLVKHPTVQKLYRQEIDRVTPDLADFERIRVFLLTDREFTIESGELTPTLKVKRREVLAAYSDAVEGLYSGAEGDKGS